MKEYAKNIDWDGVLKVITSAVISIAIAIAIVVIGFWVINIIIKRLKKIMLKKELDESLQGFLVSVFKLVLRLLVIIVALNELGVAMSSFIALIGAAGLAIGMAFSGTLSNFAGGVMILIFKPFKTHDLIEAQGELGVVDEIQIFSTILKTLDNKTIIIPNAALSNGNITNYTKEDLRRVDFTFGIGYGDRYDIAKETISKLLAEDDKVLTTPEEPFIALEALADSSVNLVVRAWTKTDHYWDVYFRLNERVYKEFEKSGLSIPYPQMDIHVHKQ